ncbi:efflux RND transporter periplasmic adaptor subunit [Crateriforma conspicua]|uniref:Cobalt-zinc-cadmium resistance protein CzcB n=1 Tax=Crateriforma conspicua TaxID=2527996 RepID=A0A5C5Y7U6_9PLAN|nr:efflux RND transporter periplasmic adaptor subunit [Crateriforma conspicua]QDV65618.1 Cobalt-zinc-cadmium resistance protein CzcB [Crateriforma conspicua]TWT71018.1 Cobalt-zinc-cadmium resistance protein CzcB [Crateriforma conspicua]
MSQKNQRSDVSRRLNWKGAISVRSDARLRRSRQRRGAIPVFPSLAAASLVPVFGLVLASSFWGGGETLDDRVLWHTVATEDLQISVIERGNLESQTNLEINCEVEDVQRDGINGTPIVWIIPNGSSVKKGDLLVEIDSTPMREELDEQILDTETARSNKIQSEADYSNQLVQNETAKAEAELKVQLAKLELEMFVDEESGTYKLAVDEIRRNIHNVNNDILEAQASLELRRDDRQGIESLYKLGYANRNELRKSELAFLQAEGSYAAQLNKLQTTLATLKRKENYEREMQLLTLDGKVKTAERLLSQTERNNEARLAKVEAILRARTESLKKEEERLERYQTQLKACKIYAPEDGMVAYASDRNTEIREGVPVRYRQHLMSLPSLSAMQVQTTVHESDLDQIQQGMKARITVDAFPEREYSGTVQSIAVLPAQNSWRGSTTKVYETVVTIDDEVAHLKPGMTAVTEIMVDFLEQIVTVPMQSIVERNGVTWVLTQQDGRLIPRQVETGRDNDSMVQIVEGLQAGESIALNPREFIDDLLETDA